MAIQIPDKPGFPTREIMRILSDIRAYDLPRERMLGVLTEMLYPHRSRNLHRRMEPLSQGRQPGDVELLIQYFEPQAEPDARPLGRIRLLLTEYGLFQTEHKFESGNPKLPDNQIPFASGLQGGIDSQANVDPHAPQLRPQSPLGDGSVSTQGGAGGGGRNGDGSAPPGNEGSRDGDEASGLRDVVAHPILFSAPQRLMAILESI